jgi:hypothetical protein
MGITTVVNYNNSARCRNPNEDHYLIINCIGNLKTTQREESWAGKGN